MYFMYGSLIVTYVWEFLLYLSDMRVKNFVFSNKSNIIDGINNEDDFKKCNNYKKKNLTGVY